MERELILEIYRSSKAYQEGHFKLSSGRHSPVYFQSALVLQDPSRASSLAERLAEILVGVSVDVVLGPAMGGIIVGHELARALGCRSVFAERSDAGFTLRRGFSLGRDERVLVAEDVLTTGLSVTEVAPVIERAGAVLVGVACMIDRRPEDRRLPWPVHSLLAQDVPTFDPVSCPLCAKGLSLTRPGSRPDNPTTHPCNETSSEKTIL